MVTGNRVYYIIDFCSSFFIHLIKLLFRKNNKEEPKKLVLIILLTILPPVIWLFARANYHLLYDFETKYDYRIKEIFNKVIAIVTAMIGMGLGFILKRLLK